MRRLLLPLSLFIAISGFAQTFNGSGGNIADNTTTEFPLNVSGLSGGLDNNHGLTDVCITIDHPSISQLQIFLVAPDGTRVALTSGTGGGGDDYTNTCFSQSAAMSVVTGTAPFTGTWRPLGNLGLVNNGQSGNGTWKLHIQDQYAPDQGSLTGWSLNFGPGAPVVPPFTTSNLPIVKIFTNGNPIPDDPKMMADMGIVYNGPGMPNNMSDPANHYAGKIGIELRGSSSLYHPKKSYAIETWTDAGADTSVSLIGMPEENDWILYAAYNDKSLLRNVLSYKLSNDMGLYASRTRFVELVLNGQYQGVYVLMEKIKRDSGRVNISKLAAKDTAGEDLTGGYIVKVDRNTGNNLGFSSAYQPVVHNNGQTVFFQYEYPSSDEIHPKQEAYIKSFIDSFEDALHNNPLHSTVNGWRKYANESSFIRFFLVNEISKNVDAYRLSTFLYKTKSTKGNQLHIGPPWDYDIAFGNAQHCEGATDTGWAYHFGNVCPDDGTQVPFWWQKLMTDTLFRNRVRCVYNDLRNTTLSTSYLFGWIDSTAAALHDAQTRNYTAWNTMGIYLWPNPQPVPEDYSMEINGLKLWLQNRLSWLDNNLPGTCHTWLGTGDLEAELSCRAVPNPFGNHLSVEISNPRSGSYHLRLISLDGKTVVAKELELPGGKNTHTLPVADLAAGVYVLQLTGAGGTVSMKLVKE